MADSATPNFSLILPEVGGSQGTWGSKTNTNWGSVDTQMKTNADAAAAAAATAAAALAKAGGVMTGRADLKTAQMTRVDKGSISGAQSLDLSAAQMFTMTITGATTLSFTNTPTGTFAQGIVLKITNGGANITWPAEVKWAGGTAPALTASGTDIVALLSFDAGTTWQGSVVKDLK
jgi:hypothetical protein